MKKIREMPETDEEGQEQDPNNGAKFSLGLYFIDVRHITS
jgi:hypothetical protein